MAGECVESISAMVMEKTFNSFIITSPKWEKLKSADAYKESFQLEFKNYNVYFLKLILF